MPDISLPNYVLPAGASATSGKTPDQMITSAFEELKLWFSKLINPLEGEWQRLHSNTNDQLATEFSLGNLVGEANGMAATLMKQVNEDLNPKPALAIKEFMLPGRATVDANIEPKFMIAAAFQSLQPWFESIATVIKPSYAKIALVPGITALDTRKRLDRLTGVVNVMKNYFLRGINKEIQMEEERQKRKQANSKPTTKRFAALVGDSDAGIDPPIPVEDATEILRDILGVTIGESDPLVANDDVTIDLGDLGDADQ